MKRRWFSRFACPYRREFDRLTALVAVSVVVSAVAIERAFVPAEATLSATNAVDARAQRFSIARQNSRADESIEAAVNADPFRADRRPARQAFRLPGEGVSVSPAVVLVADVQLMGTVLSPDGASFAMCQLGTEPPRLVRVGQKIGSYVLRAIDQGKAEFTTDDGAVIVRKVTVTGD